MLTEFIHDVSLKMPENKSLLSISSLAQAVPLHFSKQHVFTEEHRVQRRKGAEKKKKTLNRLPSAMELMIKLGIQHLGSAVNCR